MLIDHRKVLSLKILMASNHFLVKSTPLPPPKLCVTSRTYSRTIFSAFSSRPTSNFTPFCVKTCGFSSTPHATISSSGILHLTHKRLWSFLVVLGMHVVVWLIKFVSLVCCNDCYGVFILEIVSWIFSSLCILFCFVFWIITNLYNEPSLFTNLGTNDALILLEHNILVKYGNAVLLLWRNVTCNRNLWMPMLSFLFFQLRGWGTIACNVLISWFPEVNRRKHGFVMILLFIYWMLLLN